MIKTVILMAGLAGACASPLATDIPSHALRAPGSGGLAEGRKLMQAAPGAPAGGSTAITGGIDVSQKETVGDTSVKEHDASESTHIEGDTNTHKVNSGSSVSGDGNGNYHSEDILIDNSQKHTSTTHNYGGGGGDGGDGDDKGGDESGNGGDSGAMSAEAFFNSDIENNIQFR